MKIEKVKIEEVKSNKDNPRIIKDYKFKKLVQSIKEFPEMLQIRPIVVDDDNVVLGGNMRLKACKDAGLKEIYIIKADELSEDQKKEFIIKDNVNFGEWDFNILENDWNIEILENWGLEIIDDDININDIDISDNFSLPDGDKAPFQQITFTLADVQAEYIKNAIAQIKKTDDYKYCETFGNENSNGNALYLIINNYSEGLNGQS
jgi:hypothetical protein